MVLLEGTFFNSPPRGPWNRNTPPPSQLQRSGLWGPARLRFFTSNPPHIGSLPTAADLPRCISHLLLHLFSLFNRYIQKKLPSASSIGTYSPVHRRCIRIRSLQQQQPAAEQPSKTQPCSMPAHDAKNLGLVWSLEPPVSDPCKVCCLQQQETRGIPSSINLPSRKRVERNWWSVKRMQKLAGIECRMSRGAWGLTSTTGRQI